MIRRPPRSTLFPYRRSSDLFTQDPSDNGAFADPTNAGLKIHFTAKAQDPNEKEYYLAICKTNAIIGIRSEEHTSELQSRSDLVCRLLLEKKKNYMHIMYEHR